MNANNPILRIYLCLALLVVAGPLRSEASPFPTLRRLQTRLAKLTAPSVCHAQRDDAIARATAAVTKFCEEKARTAGCERLKVELDAAKNKRCETRPAATAVKQVVAAFERRANEVSRRTGFRPPFDTFVLEPAGIVPHVTAVFLHGAGMTDLSIRLLVEEVRRGMKSGLLPARVLVPVADNRTNPFIPGLSYMWSAIDNSEMEAAARNVSALLDADAALLATDRWLAGVAGHSQGAFLALAVSLRSRVSGVAALSGGLRNISIPDAATRRVSDDAETAFIVGDGDGNLVRMRESQRVLRRLGRTTRFFVIEDAGHNFENTGAVVGSKAQVAIREMLTELRKGMFPGWGRHDVSSEPIVWKWQK